MFNSFLYVYQAGSPSRPSPPKGQSPKPSPKAYLHRWTHPENRHPYWWYMVVPSPVMVGLWHWVKNWVYHITISTYMNYQPVSTYIKLYQAISTYINLYHCWNSISLVVKKKQKTSQFGIVITLWEHETSFGSVHNSHWIGLRENLQETMVFTFKYRAFRLKFSHHPILWNYFRTDQMVEGLVWRDTTDAASARWS